MPNYPTAGSALSTSRIATGGDPPADINAVDAEVNAVTADLVTARGGLSTMALKIAAMDATAAAIDLATTAAVAGASYTLVIGDRAKAINFSAASPTITVPPNSSVAFPVGTVIELYQSGTGVMTVTPGAGVTITSPGSILTSGGQFSTLSLRKDATDAWVLAGTGSSSGAGASVVTPVRTASIGNVTIPPGGTSLSIGTVTLANGDRVLLKDQTTRSQNGVYVVGGIGTSVTLTRATDLDVSAEFIPGLLIFVLGGSHAGTTWQFCNLANSPTIGTTPLTFTRVHPPYTNGSVLGGDAFYGDILESHPREFAHLVTGTITSGTIYVQPLGTLRAGHTISTLTFCAAGTAAATPTNQWAGICNVGRVIRGISADGTTGAWAAFNPKTFALGAAYTAVADEDLFSFIMVAAATPPSLCVSNTLSSAISDAGTSGTGQTTPPASGTTLAALTATANNAKCSAA